MVESLELRRLLSYSVTPVVDSEPEPGTNFGAGIASNGNLALVPNALAANFDGKVLLIDTTDGSVVRTFNNPTEDVGVAFGSGVAWVGDKIVIGASEIDQIFVYDNATDPDPDVIDNPHSSISASFFGVAMTAFEGDLLASNSSSGDGEVFRFDLDAPGNPFVASYSYDNATNNPDLTQLGTAIAVHNGKIYAAAKDLDSAGVVVEFDAIADALPPVPVYQPGTFQRLITEPGTPTQGPVPFGSDLAVAGNNLLVGAKDANAVYQINLTSLASVSYAIPDGADPGLGFGIAVNGNQVALGNLASSGSAVFIYNWADPSQVVETLSNPPETNDASNESDTFGRFINALPDGGWLVADPSDDLDSSNFDTGAVYIFTPDAPTNQAPTANAGVDQTTTENATVTLDAGGSTDPDDTDDTDDITEYAWDFNNDDVYDAFGQTTPFTRDLPGTVTVKLRVTDSADHEAFDTVDITFTDVAPTANAGADQLAVTNQTVNVAGSGANTAGDLITGYAWDLDNDGQFDDAFTASASTSFATSGAKTVRLRVTDDDGQTAIDTMIVNVSATPLVVGGTIFIGGTTGTDNVAIKKNGSGSTVTVNGQNTNFTVSHIVVFGGSGADTITVSPSANVSLEAYGGGGNDSISGGSGNDILVGGEGNDVLYGGAGLDLIIGGNGADGVYGEVEDDILIAPSTVHDNNSVALNQILTIWTNGQSFASRVTTLKNGLLTAGQEVPQLHDGSSDILTGKNGDDFFIFDANEDIATDIKTAESVQALSFVPVV
jgi:hypothetical protein